MGSSSSKNNDEITSHEGSPLLSPELGNNNPVTETIPSSSSRSSKNDSDEITSQEGSDEDEEFPYVAPPSPQAKVNRGRILLFLVAFLYGSLSVSLRMVYARPGPPAASILSATRGWMTVLCLLPVVLTPNPRPPSSSSSSGHNNNNHHSRFQFYGFCLELAIFNFGTQGLLNIGLLTTESARSAFFTQLSVVITPVLAATIGACTQQRVVVKPRVWIACGIALAGLFILSSSSSSSSLESDDTANGLGEDTSDTDDGGGSNGSLLLDALVSSENGSNFLHLLSFGDWCCVGSAFCWSYYIYRLSDWGDRYDEARTMFVKNVFMAILYTSWTVASYFWTIAAEPEIDSSSDDGFVLWKGWRDPIALSILFYTALSSGALSDVLQQTAQAHVPAAESNVLLSLEPVFAALLGLLFLHEIPSFRECLGGTGIILASFLAST